MKKMQIEQVYSIAWKQYEMVLAKPKNTANVNSQSQSSEARAGEVDGGWDGFHHCLMGEWEH